MNGKIYNLKELTEYFNNKKKSNKHIILNTIIHENDKNKNKKIINLNNDNVNDKVSDNVNDNDNFNVNDNDKVSDNVSDNKKLNNYDDNDINDNENFTITKNNNDNDNITLVTAYFKMSNKYNDSLYIEWIERFLKNYQKNIVIFTSIESFYFIQELRKDFKEKTVIILSSIESFYVYKYYDYFVKDYNRDIEKSYHNPNLFLIWNEKLKFVEKAIKLNPFNSSYFMWCDIGMIREDNYIKYLKTFPNIEKITEDKVYLLNIDYNFTEEDYKNPYDEKYRFIFNIIGGGVMIGLEKNMRLWINRYYKTLDYYITNNKFAGKDQTIMVSTYLKYPDFVKLIKGVDDDDCNKWFYLLKYFS
jgi:hypothetical protein